MEDGLGPKAKGLSRRIWFLLGVISSFSALPLLSLSQRIGLWTVRPCAYFIFQPGRIALWPFGEFLQTHLSNWLVGMLVLLTNAAIFGLLTCWLRRWFAVLIAVLLVLIYLTQPPSDKILLMKFEQQKPLLEQMISKAAQTPNVVRITKYEFEDVKGNTYKAGENQRLLSRELWSEYQEILKKTGMNEGIYRLPKSGQTEILAKTIFGKIGPIGTLYGYAYCPSATQKLGEGFLPCTDPKDEFDDGDYRYKLLAPDWFLVEIFQTNSLTN